MHPRNHKGLNGWNVNCREKRGYSCSWGRRHVPSHQRLSMATKSLDCILRIIESHWSISGGPWSVWGFPGGSAGKESACSMGYLGSIPGFDPWVGKIPWRRERLPTPVFWPGEFHELDHGVTKSRTWLSDFHITSHGHFHILDQSLRWQCKGGLACQTEAQEQHRGLLHLLGWWDMKPDRQWSRKGLASYLLFRRLIETVTHRETADDFLFWRCGWRRQMVLEA